MLCKKGALKNVAKLTGKHFCQSLSLNKAAGWELRFYRTPPVAASGFLLEKQSIQYGSDVKTFSGTSSLLLFTVFFFFQIIATEPGYPYQNFNFRRRFMFISCLNFKLARLTNIALCSYWMLLKPPLAATNTGGLSLFSKYASRGSLAIGARKFENIFLVFNIPCSWACHEH